MADWNRRGKKKREMERDRSFFFFVAIAVALTLSLHFVPAASQEVEDEKEFSYQRNSNHGPEHWGEISKTWEKCNGGHMQSPIDLMEQKMEVTWHLGNLLRNYRPAPVTLINRGHDIMMKWKDGAGGIWVNGSMCFLKQVHWHSPSEHAINGRRFELELHMVHMSADDKIAVVAIMYKIGRPDPFLAELETYIHAIKNIKNGEEEVGIVDPRHIKRGSRKYYRYVGSLTTPPCTEGVVWTIVKKVRTVSVEQIKLLRDAVNDESVMNARPIQPIYHRNVELYRPQA